MMDEIGTSSENWNKKKFEDNQRIFLELISTYQNEHAEIKLGGGTIAIERQHNKKRLTARERIDHLIDPGTSFFELGIYAAWNIFCHFNTSVLDLGVKTWGKQGVKYQKKLTKSFDQKNHPVVLVNCPICPQLW